LKRAPRSLRSQALAWLARREHSRAELRSKLLGHARKLMQAECEAAAETAVHALDSGPPAAIMGLHEGSDEAAWGAQVDEVLDWLNSRGLQSDARFIESRVHARAPRQGQALIRMELSRHGVEMDDDTAQQLRDTELARAKEVWRRRFGAPAADAAGRARQMRFLAARGFGGEVVRRVVGGKDDD
jgi:regulatory protein